MAIAITNYPTEPFNSYASLVYFKARLDQQLRVYTGKTDDQLASALIDATEFMEVRHAFVGYRRLAGQVREWPREEAYDARGDKVIGIHTALINACCEYAWRRLSQELYADPARDETGQVIKSKEEKVGPLATSVTYDNAAGTTMPSYPLADGMLIKAGLVRRRSGFSVGTLARS